MKKVLSVVMVFAVMASLTACGSGSKFKTHQKKNIKAAEEACDASEGSSKQKKKFFKNQTDADFYEDGIYFVFETDELEDVVETGSMFEGTDVDSDQLTNVFIFRKDCNDEDTNFFSIIYELDSKDAAEEIYDVSTEKFKKTEKQLKKAAKESDIEYAADGSDTEYSLIAINNDREEAMSVYAKLDGKVVIMVCYDGASDSDLLDEFYEYMSIAGYTDMEELLEDA